MDMTTRGLPVAGEFYRHFKGNLYQIIGIAYDEATMMQLVVYQALYGEYRWYVRPAAEFLSPVDKEKYPESTAEYRFERVNPADFAEGGQAVSYVTAQNIEMREIRKDAKHTVAAQETARHDSSASWSNPEEEQVRPELLRFLDAETPAEKLAILREIRRSIDGELMTNIELSIDLMPDEKEPLERRLELVEMNLEKRVRYEGGRLR